MKQYVACEVRILEWTAEEIVRTSTEVSKDHFGDEWWTNIIGGQGV